MQRSATGLHEGVFYPGNETPLIAVGPVTFWEEGVSYALLVFFRALVVVCAVLILVFSTHPKSMMVAFIDKGLSPKLAYVFMASLQFIPEMQRRARAIIEAQQARGLDLEANLWRRFQALLAMMIPLLAGALISVETRSLALEARGFSRVRDAQPPDRSARQNDRPHNSLVHGGHGGARRGVADSAVSLIGIEDLTFSYTSQPHEPALRNLSCTIERGSFVGITGPAEAGKSSFCRLIAGYIPHFFHGEFSGKVSVAGTNTRETTIGELAEKVGFVFENPFDQLTGASLTVLEEAAFALANMGLSREEIRPRAEKSLSQVGMEDLTDRHPQQLSGGQSQRLALASVLAVQPEVFILDEPTSQLDPLGVEEVFAVISDMHRRGYTVIVVSQDLDHLAIHADRLIVIDQGQIRWDAEPRKVLLEATQAGYSILIPDVLEISRKLRAAERISAGSPLPLTVEQAATELSSIEERGSAAEAITAGKTSLLSKLENSDELVFEDVYYDYPTGVSAICGISLRLERGCVCIVGQTAQARPPSPSISTVC